MSEEFPSGGDNLPPKGDVTQDSAAASQVDVTQQRDIRERLTEAELRHPNEKTIFYSSLVVNIGMMVIAILLVMYAHDWLKEHPVLAGFIKHIRAFAIAAVFAPPAIALIRNIRRGFVLGNSLPLSREQIPEIYELLEQHCARLGVPLPELYLGDKVAAPPAQSFSTLNHDYIILNIRYIERKPKKSRDVVSFFLGREMGRIRLRHTAWWYEMLLSYVIKIPYIKIPMTQVQTLYHDRYGAYLEPNCLPGLIILTVGRRLLGEVDFLRYLSNVQAYGGFWPVVSNFTKSRPHLAYRMQALIKAGLITPEGVANAARELALQKEKEKEDKKKEKKKKKDKDKDNVVAPDSGWSKSA